MPGKADTRPSGRNTEAANLIFAKAWSKTKDYHKSSSLLNRLVWSLNLSHHLWKYNDEFEVHSITASEGGFPKLPTRKRGQEKPARSLECDVHSRDTHRFLEVCECVWDRPLEVVIGRRQDEFLDLRAGKSDARFSGFGMHN